MSNKAVILSVVAVAGAVVLYLLYKKSATAPSASGGSPVNALPARQYALPTGSNPFGQPPQATFTPASGVAVAEGLLSAFGAGRSVNQALSSSDANPQSFDVTDNAQVTSTDSGTTTFFG